MFANVQMELMEKSRELELAEKRLARLSLLIWETRWADNEGEDHTDYQDMVGLAAAVNSGNYEPLDKLMEKGDRE